MPPVGSLDLFPIPLPAQSISSDVEEGFAMQEGEKVALVREF